GQKAYVTLMNLSGYVDTYYTNLEDAAKTANDILQGIANERKGLQDEFDSLTMTPAELLKKQRDALDESNRSLFDQIQVLKDAKQAEEDLKTAREEATRVAKRTEDLQIQLLEAEGKSNEALLKRRELILAGLDNDEQR
ncbi:hypothetical protein, partial [Staphylococcus aureus]|uniref:hypothetical protein n=1 Tax=Staphylococcus aureus TaxID=1280 RepID=UPI0039BDB287